MQTSIHKPSRRDVLRTSTLSAVSLAPFGLTSRPSFASTYARGAKVPAGFTERMKAQVATTNDFEEQIRSNQILNSILNSSGTPLASPATLPPRHDWRETNHVTPVRQQGGCGSCWIFASIAAYESAFLKANKDAQAGKLSVSTQEILDCSFAETNCVVGGFHDVAFTYMQLFGLVDEAKYPYNAVNPARGAYCNSNLGDRPYFIRSWSYVDADKYIPSVDALKRALMQHGPLVSSVTADGSWDRYSKDYPHLDVQPSTVKPDDINHEVLIIGWDDKQKNQGFKDGSWIVKNSWGSDWGAFSGYAYLPYGSSNIGFGASWVTAFPSSRALGIELSSFLRRNISPSTMSIPSIRELR